MVQTQWLKIVLAIVFPLILMIIWGLYFAPKAVNRLDMTYLLIGKIIIMFLAVSMLWYMKETTQAIILAVMIIGHLILTIALKQEA